MRSFFVFGGTSFQLKRLVSEFWSGPSNASFSALKRPWARVPLNTVTVKSAQHTGLRGLAENKTSCLKVFCCRLFSPILVLDMYQNTSLLGGYVPLEHLSTYTHMHTYIWTTHPCLGQSIQSSNDICLSGTRLSWGKKQPQPSS